MKKKYRTIVCNQKTYGWTTGYSTLQIWFNKKVIWNENVEHITVTPQLVADVINENKL